MDRVVEQVVRHRIIIGVALFALGLGATMWLAFAAASKSPLDGAFLEVLGGTHV